MHRTLLACLALCACAAPDPFVEDANIEILHPPPTEPLVRTAEGVIEFLLVVDIDGLIFAPDQIGEANSDGTGHYHVSLEDTYLTAPADLSTEVFHTADDTPNLSSAAQVHVRVSLQNNDHSDYDDPDGDGTPLADWEHIIAYDIVDG